MSVISWITPLSTRWRDAIQQRIEEAKKITTLAVTRGAKPHAGLYWDLSGTFLFTVYVMTALGFGAPVPQTFGGRVSALTYAILAVPTHFYLMLQSSKGLVVFVERFMAQWRQSDQASFVEGKPTLGNESSTCSQNSEILKATNRSGVAKKIMGLLSVLGACHSLPLAGFLYYVTGACIFGVMRDLGSLQTLMFPLEFTTSGKLEQIPGHIRIMYGFYVEGAMMLLACALAVLRRHGHFSLDEASKKHRLFASD